MRFLQRRCASLSDFFSKHIKLFGVVTSLPRTEIVINYCKSSQQFVAVSEHDFLTAK